MKPKLVVVDWGDSSMVHGWKADVPQTQPTHCRSVGWIIHQDKVTLVIAPNLGIDTSGEIFNRACELTIPVAAITRIRELRLPR